MEARLKRPARPHILKTRERDAAKMKLETGPARATRVVSRTGFLKLAGLKGTGLAQPIIREKNSIRVPMGSRWARGLRVSRPSSLAVLSPR